MDFVEDMVKFATFEEADGLCKKHTTQWGKTCTPGGQERPKVAPFDLKTRFFIEHNSGSQCHRDKGAGSFDSDDQSASQDHCEAIKPRP